MAQHDMDSAELRDAYLEQRAVDYDARCKEQTSAQGLDPILERLRSEGIDGVGLEQTGGFCMVVTVTRGDTVHAVVKDGTDEARPYLLGTYTREAWEDTGDEALSNHPDLTLDEVVERVR